MSYYMEENDDFNDGDHPIHQQSMFNDNTEPVSESEGYDSDLNNEITKWVNDDIKQIENENNNKDNVKHEIDVKYSDMLSPKNEDVEDDKKNVVKEPDSKPPVWYKKIFEKKQIEAKKRMENLGRLISYENEPMRQHIRSMERDHCASLCKSDGPRHPLFKYPWRNFWRFNCVYSCKYSQPEPGHVCSDECEKCSMKHFENNNTKESEVITEHDFPQYVMSTVQMFEDFVNSMPKKINSHYKYEKPKWNHIKLRGNKRGELMMIACGKEVSFLERRLEHVFKDNKSVESLYIISLRGKQKKSQQPPKLLFGQHELQDKVGSLIMKYTYKTSIHFNSALASELHSIMLEYLEPLSEDTHLLEIGCNTGEIGLMLAPKCFKVIGLNTLSYELDLANETKRINQLSEDSIMFMECNPKEVYDKCSPLLIKERSVAILNLSTVYGKSHDVTIALRDFPSVWRVVVYGSFTKEFHKVIHRLTALEDNRCDEFYPMRACILDKSMKDEDSFDIVILFERTSLIESKPNIKSEVKKEPEISTKLEQENLPNSGLKDDFPQSKNTIKIKSENTSEKSTDLEFQSPSNIKLDPESNENETGNIPTIRIKSEFQNTNCESKDAPVQRNSLGFSMDSQKSYLSKIPINEEDDEQTNPQYITDLNIKKEPCETSEKVGNQMSSIRVKPITSLMDELQEPEKITEENSPNKQRMQNIKSEPIDEQEKSDHDKLNNENETVTSVKKEKEIIVKRESCEQQDSVDTQEALESEELQEPKLEPDSPDHEPFTILDPNEDLIELDRVGECDEGLNIIKVKEKKRSPIRYPPPPERKKPAALSTDRDRAKRSRSSCSPPTKKFIKREKSPRSDWDKQTRSLSGWDSQRHLIPRPRLSLLTKNKNPTKFDRSRSSSSTKTGISLPSKKSYRSRSRSRSPLHRPHRSVSAFEKSPPRVRPQQPRSPSPPSWRPERSRSSSYKPSAPKFIKSSPPSHHYQSRSPSSYHRPASKSSSTINRYTPRPKVPHNNSGSYESQSNYVRQSRKVDYRPSKLNWLYAQMEDRPSNE